MKDVLEEMMKTTPLILILKEHMQHHEKNGRESQERRTHRIQEAQGM